MKGLRVVEIVALAAALVPAVVMTGLESESTIIVALDVSNIFILSGLSLRKPPVCGEGRGGWHNTYLSKQQMNKNTNKQKNGSTDKQTHKQKNGSIDKHTHKQINLGT